jgi:hypothetical protein
VDKRIDPLTGFGLWDASARAHQSGQVTAIGGRYVSARVCAQADSVKELAADSGKSLELFGGFAVVLNHSSDKASEGGSSKHVAVILVSGSLRRMSRSFRRAARSPLVRQRVAAAPVKETWILVPTARLHTTNKNNAYRWREA